LDIYRQILVRNWGFNTFRPMQEEVIQSIGSGRDTLVLMPTGSGKSITFQVPALAKDGLCIVVTPLIALMKDQVEKLKKRNIKALAVHSGMSKEEIDISLDNCVYGDFKFLYCSPERLGTPIFRERFKKMKVSFIAVDEAHCISQWGYDFRPSYLRIIELRGLRPELSFIALTASATPEVAEDIQDKLKLKNCAVFHTGFERKNIAWVVREVEDKTGYLMKIIESTPGSGIIYVRNRAKTAEIAKFLQGNKITADFYHAGLTDEARHMKQDDWQSDKTRIIVSTNAFGMGIDKNDVRFVIHYDLPDCIESYYQEAGRAGRDDKKAYAILLFNKNDELSVQKRIEINYPDIPAIKEVYHQVCNYLRIPVGSGKFMTYDFDLQNFSFQYKQNAYTVFSSLKILEQEGYIEYTEDLNTPSKVHFTIDRDDLYHFQVENATFDNFIKLLLRSYTGMFTEYVSIDEGVIAKRANTTQDIVYQYLLALAKRKIINYIPRRRNPVIIFTEERLDEKTLYISPGAYNERKDRYISKINAMLAYAQSDHKCRSEIILGYFGEKETYRCGQCDNCQQRNELGVSKYEFDLVAEELKKLADGINTTEVILDELNKLFPGKKNIEIFRWLLDNDKMSKDDMGKIMWKH
jgi:ATP-dependent DNA helicase RecQ